MSATPNSSLPTPVFCQDKTVAERYGVSRATIWRWAAEGRIPKPIKLSPGCVRWNLKSLEEFEQKQAQQSGA